MRSELTRRGALRAIAGLGLGAATIGCGSAGDGSDDGAIETPLSCVLTPEQVEGPFFLDTGLLRRDITEGRPGAPLKLQLRLASVSGSSCEPLSGALVEAWHTDADGVYSGYDVANGNPRDAAGGTFMRGYQVSDDRGLVEFSTIYPGWYPGRTIHIHLMVRLDSTSALTTQLYFPDSLSDTVLSRAPYDSRGSRTTNNANDALARTDLDQLTSTISRSGDGYQATFGIGVAG